MKSNSVLMALALALTASPAFAVDTTKVYSSGLLIVVFIGVCALLVVSQMIPAILLLLGMVKGLVANLLRGKVVSEPIEK